MTTTNVPDSTASTDSQSPFEGFSVSEGQLLSRALRPTVRAGDTLCLSDDRLMAAHNSSRPLAASEREALLASPLTMARFRVLIHRALVDAAKSTETVVPINVMTEAANDAVWISYAPLRAADDQLPLAALTTEDGVWSLVFFDDLDGAGWVCRLRLLDTNVGYADAVLDGSQPVDVRDALGELIMSGTLNRYGELSAPWTLAETPSNHLRAVGGWGVFGPRT